MNAWCTGCVSRPPLPSVARWKAVADLNPAAAFVFLGRLVSAFASPAFEPHARSASRLTRHWHDSEEITYIMFNSGKHSRVFADDVLDG
jgi:hypothetical protein